MRHINKPPAANELNASTFPTDLLILRCINWLRCLCRPTAAELLKHPFFKKAKESDFLVQTIIEKGPSFASRAKRVSYALLVVIARCRGRKLSLIRKEIGNTKCWIAKKILLMKTLCELMRKLP